MYIYIMERTQIYLTGEQTGALDREARRTGTTRSHLIREAIDARYATAVDRRRIARALKATAGLWKDRAETGADYVERVRTGRRLRELHTDDTSDEPEA